MAGGTPQAAIHDLPAMGWATLKRVSCKSATASDAAPKADKETTQASVACKPNTSTRLFQRKCGSLRARMAV